MNEATMFSSHNLNSNQSQILRKPNAQEVIQLLKKKTIIDLDFQYKSNPFTSTEFDYAELDTIFSDLLRERRISKYQSLTVNAELMNQIYILCILKVYLENNKLTGIKGSHYAELSRLSNDLTLEGLEKKKKDIEKE